MNMNIFFATDVKFSIEKSQSYPTFQGKTIKLFLNFYQLKSKNHPYSILQDKKKHVENRIIYLIKYISINRNKSMISKKK